MKIQDHETAIEIMKRLINILPDYDCPDWNTRLDDIKCDVHYAKHQLINTFVIVENIGKNDGTNIGEKRFLNFAKTGSSS